MADFSENIFQAIDILTKKQIEAVKFDETISAVITDTSKAENGEYIVSTGGTKFTAYSTETKYRVDDTVMVTIPQGNYDNQKIIIGKQVDTNSNSALVFRSPFINFVDATKNIATADMAAVVTVIEENEEVEKVQYFLPNGVVANDPDRGCWSTDTLNFYNSTNKVLLWASKEDLGYADFSRLGIKADFQTFLHEYNAICGNYGLAVEITFATNELTENNSFVNVFTFDSDTYFGDIYNFQTAFSQEQVFDISEFNEFYIKQIKVYLYQRANFYDMYNEAVPYKYDTGIKISEDETTLKTSLANNIIVSNLYVSLGIDADEFVNDTATLLTNSSLRYYKGESSSAEDLTARKESNLKEIELRWIHKDEESGYITTISENKIPPNYEVRWYRYKLGAPSPDALAGAHWQRIYNLRTAPLDESGEWVVASTSEYVEVVKEDTENWTLTSDTYYIKEDNEFVEHNLTYLDLANPLAYDAQSGFKKSDGSYVKLYEVIEDIFTNSLSIQFEPNVNLASEKIKAIILKKEETNGIENFERKIAASQELEFVNDTDVRSQATVIDENALSIRFNDEEKGNYFLYNRAGEIGKDEDGELRTLTAVFDFDEHDVYQKAPLVDAYSIKWTFPAEPTMIYPAATGAENDETNSNVPLDPSAEHVFSNFSFYEAGSPGGQTEGTWHYLADAVSVGFFIKKKLNRNATNNTIRLEVIKDGQEFTAQAQLLFGTAGTSGSDYTIVLTWDNGENAFDTSKNSLTGHLILMDQTGLPITDHEGTWECEWYKVSEASATESTNLVKETRNIKYPVIDDDNQVEVVNRRRFNPDSREYVNYFITSGTEYFEYNPDSKKFTSSNNTVSYPYLYATTNLQLTKLEFFPVDNVIPNPNPNPDSEDLDNCLDVAVEELPAKPSGANGDEPLDLESAEWITWWGNQTGDYQTAYTEWKDKYDACVIRREEQTALNTACATYRENKGSLSFDNNGESTYYHSQVKRLFVKQDNMYILDPWDQYLETETYYYPQYTTERELVYSHLQIGCDENENSKVVVEPKGTPDKSALLKSLYLIKVTLNNFGDYPLKALFPLPIKNKIDNANEKRVVDYIEGPADVRYSTAGETDFDKNVYQITTRRWDSNIGQWQVERHGYNDSQYQEVTITSSIYDGNSSQKYYIIDGENQYVLANGDFDNTVQYYIKSDKQPLNGYWEFLTYDTTTDSNFLPKLIETGETVSETGTQFDIPKLDPPSVYFAETPLCGVSFYKQVGNSPNSNDDIILWTQPILMYQDNYPSTTLNKWTGKDIVTDDETGTITASGLAAGKKEKDNTFTGVILGDWSRTDTDPFVTEQTGVYGFNHGTMSYALKDDGTAFFGKDGHGRIYFNGNKAQIYSALWKTSEQGMLLDIDDGFIKINGEQNNGGRASIYISPNGTSNSTPYFLIIDNLNKDLIRIQNNKYYLQTSNFDTSSETGTKIDLQNGTITSYNFTIKALTGSNNAKSGIHMTSKGLPYLDIQDNGKHLLYIRKPISANLQGEYYLQSSDFDEVYNGSTLNLAASKGVRIDLKDGKITGFNFAIRAYSEQGGIYINSGATLYPFQIIGGTAKSVTSKEQVQITYIYNSSSYQSDLYSITKNDITDYAVRLNRRYYYIEGNGDTISGTLIWVTVDDATVLSEVSDSDISDVILVQYEKPSSIFTLGTQNVSISWDGTLYANNAQISGTITGATINGGSITGSSINGGSITGSSIYGGTITGGTISAGTIVGAYLTGNLNAGSSGTITGGTISGANLYGAGNAFSVTNDGQIDLNGWLFNSVNTWAGNELGTWRCQYLRVNFYYNSSTGNFQHLGALAWEDDIKKKITLNYIKANKYYYYGSYYDIPANKSVYCTSEITSATTVYTGSSPTGATTVYYYTLYVGDGYVSFMTTSTVGDTLSSFQNVQVTGYTYNGSGTYYTGSSSSGAMTLYPATYYVYKSTADEAITFAPAGASTTITLNNSDVS